MRRLQIRHAATAAPISDGGGRAIGTATGPLSPPRKAVRASGLPGGRPWARAEGQRSGRRPTTLRVGPHHPRLGVPLNGGTRARDRYPRCGAETPGGSVRMRIEPGLSPVGSDAPTPISRSICNGGLFSEIRDQYTER